MRVVIRSRSAFNRSASALARAASSAFPVRARAKAYWLRVISVSADRTKRVSYGELVAGQPFHVTLSTTAPRQPASAWTVLGQPVPRLDMAAMATGQFEYVHNVRVPGMVHGRVVRPPAVGATVIDVAQTSVRTMPGVIQVVVRHNFVSAAGQDTTSLAMW